VQVRQTYAFVFVLTSLAAGGQARGVWCCQCDVSVAVGSDTAVNFLAISTNTCAAHLQRVCVRVLLAVCHAPAWLICLFRRHVWRMLWAFYACMVT
jgi:hypothetical protein